ncbi:MAG: WavE lipopolysaccharide synthesis family protein [Ignavibacteria bacterium]|nr:WavE lipopolysaccharide synthesis family protein [Ignavibacteria bacterium]
MISDRDISFVVQGPITIKTIGDKKINVTAEALESIRKYYPNSEIILSTYKNSDLSGLQYDVCVENDDPGATTFNDDILKGKYHNINRQLFTTGNGLKRASRKHCVKTRTDCLIVSNSLLNIDTSQYRRNDNFGYFENRIALSELYTRDPVKFPFLFQFTDIFQFGLTVDLKSLWDIELAPEPETTRYFENKRLPKFYLLKNYNYLFRCSAEQYLWSSFLIKKGLKARLKHPSHINYRLFKLSEYFLINNCIVFSQKDLGIQLPEHMRGSDGPGNLLYTNKEWIDLYNWYIVKNNKTKILFRYFAILRYKYRFFKKYFIHSDPKIFAG